MNGTFTLSFIDEDGDSVMIGGQADVDSLKEMCQNKEVMRIDVMTGDSQMKRNKGKTERKEEFMMGDQKEKC